MYCTMHVHHYLHTYRESAFDDSCVIVFFMLGLIWLVRENQKNENIIVLAFSLDVHVCNKLCFILKPVIFFCAQQGYPEGHSFKMSNKHLITPTGAF